jgi:hypothetical protein
MWQEGMGYWDHNIATGHTYKCGKKVLWLCYDLSNPFLLATFVCMSCGYVMIPVTHSFLPHLYVCPHRTYIQMWQEGMGYWDHNIATGHTYKCGKKEWVTEIIT